MIVGTLTILALLFGSGSFEAFFLLDLDNGVKEFVMEKDRQKEILSGINDVEKRIVAFNKTRASDFKHFKEMNEDRNTSEEAFSKLFQDIQTKRDSLQNEIIDSRIIICNKIQQNEWDSIVVFSKSSYAKIQAKAKKKGDKDMKQLFVKTGTIVTETIADDKRNNAIMEGLDGMSLKLETLLSKSETVDSDDHSVFTRKEASKEELLLMSVEMNELRNLIYKEIVGFHFTVTENTSSEEWSKIIKSFNKELEMAEY